MAPLATFQKRLETSIQNGDNSWHRLFVKVECGRIKVVQLHIDETYAVDDKLESL
jgi:hypothetical protein